MTQIASLPGAKPIDYKSVPAGAATSVWAAAVAKADAVGGRYCEDCHVAEVVDAPGFTFSGVRPYALNPERAQSVVGEERADGRRALRLSRTRASRSLFIARAGH